MPTTVKKTVAAALAALTLSAALVGASPASAGGWHHYHGGFWGPGVAFGVLGLAAGAIAASQYAEGGCVRYRPVYDAYGNYVGQRAINIC